MQYWQGNRGCRVNGLKIDAVCFMVENICCNVSRRKLVLGGICELNKMYNYMYNIGLIL